MAKTSVIARNKKRTRMAANQLARRNELRALSIDPGLSPEDREAARMKLQSLPRNGAPNRLVNRCSITGRAKAVYKKFMLSRIQLRELAHQGQIPGMRKSSW